MKVKESFRPIVKLTVLKKSVYAFDANSRARRRRYKYACKNPGQTYVCYVRSLVHVAVEKRVWVFAYQVEEDPGIVRVAAESAEFLHMMAEQDVFLVSDAFYLLILDDQRDLKRIQKFFKTYRTEKDVPCGLWESAEIPNDFPSEVPTVTNKYNKSARRIDKLTTTTDLERNANVVGNAELKLDSKLVNYASGIRFRIIFFNTQPSPFFCG